jgi:hypothetical protein
MAIDPSRRLIWHRAVIAPWSEKDDNTLLAAAQAHQSLATVAHSEAEVCLAIYSAHSLLYMIVNSNFLFSGNVENKYSVHKTLWKQ